MNYKLINKQTNEEHICSKVVIDGFDYYYIDELIPYNPNGGTNGNFVCLGEIESNKDHNVKLGDKQYVSPFVKNVGDCGGCRKLIATNNPSIDLPKVVDEVEKLAINNFGSIGIGRERANCFIGGYNKSQESHPFSEEDMIEFAKFCLNLSKDNKQIIRDNPDITTEELLQIWKEQRTKTIYYN